MDSECDDMPVQVLLLGWQVLPYLGSGPFWSTDSKVYVGNCDRDWWKSLLLIDNIFGGEGSVDACMGHYWCVCIPSSMGFLIIGRVCIPSTSSTVYNLASRAA
eukprot:1178346-Prorocentrum_minimum.AAC.3